VLRHRDRPAQFAVRRKKPFPVIARSSKALDERIRAKWAKDLPKDF
jgi:hypothetical protein